MQLSTTMSYTNGDDNSDVVDQNAVISRVPGVLDSIQLQQVAGLTKEMSRMMETTVNDTSSNVATNIRQQIEELKRQKARKKSGFTKARRAMLILLDKDLPSKREIRSQQQKVEDYQEEAMIVMEALMDMYTAVGDQEGVKKINQDLDILERECMSKQKKYQLEQWQFESTERKKAFGRVGETDGSNKGKQNNSGSKGHQGKRRNTEGKRDKTTRTSADRNENQSQYQSTRRTKRKC